MAAAMRRGSLAPAIAVFKSTPSAPSSMHSATSEAVPTPASTMTGTSTSSIRMRIAFGFRTPCPEPIGEPAGMTAAAPSSARRTPIRGSSEQ